MIETKSADQNSQAPDTQNDGGQAFQPALLEAVAGATDVMLVYLDLEFNFVWVNDSYARTCQMRAEEMIGRNHFELYPDAENEAIFRRVRDTGTGVFYKDKPFEFPEQPERGMTYWDCGLAPVKDSAGQVEGLVFSLRETTEVKRAELRLSRRQQQLLDAKVVAEKARQAKSRFLSAANHDLRQPLHAMKLLVHSLSLQESGPAAVQTVKDITNAVQSLEGMLSTFFDISKLDAGVIIPKECDFRLAPVMGRLQRQFSDAAKELGKQVHIVNSDPVIHTDPILLERILQHFLSNAINHAAGQHVLMGCRRVGAHRRIEVWDTGSGIPADQLDKIFDDFYQIGNSAPASSRGLGLSVTRRIADLLGLRLLVRSIIGKGSVFSVEVPLGQEADHASEQEPVATGLPTGGPPCVLVVDDNQDVLQATKMLLVLCGHDVIIASCAQQALDLIKKREHRIDVMLIDYRLPNGWDGLRLIRSVRSAIDREIPAILVTGDTSLNDLTALDMSGINILCKPFDAPTLRRQIEVVLRKDDLTPREPSKART